MIFKETVSITGSNAAATTFASKHLVGQLVKMRLVAGTMTTKKTMEFGIVGESSTLNFAKQRLHTSDLNWYPTLLGQGSTGKTSTDSGYINVRQHPVTFANEQIKIYVQATTDASALTATAYFYIDGIPGLGGTTTT